MTTIAYDGKHLAADRLITNGDHRYGEATKIHTLADGRTFAAAGAMDFIHAVMAWLNGSDKPEIKDNDSFIGLVVAKNGDAQEISQNLRIWPACIPWAGGTGEAFALTAMKCGKNAIEAVEIAIEMDIYSGGKVESCQIGD